MGGTGFELALAATGLGAGLCAWLAGGLSNDDLRAYADAAGRLLSDLLVRARSLADVVQTMGPSGPRATLGEVAEMIDMVRLGLSAGLSFDASLELYCGHRSSALAAELGRARLRWRVGATTRGDALKEVARTLGVRPLESFAIAVDEAMELGAPLSDALESQSRECRAAHRAHVERGIERAPVKILIPTGTLILPALLLSIMGPLMAAGGMI